MSKYEFTVLALWAIAIAATLLVHSTDPFTYLGPVFFVCMVGSILVVRQARRSKGRGGDRG